MKKRYLALLVALIALVPAYYGVVLVSDSQESLETIRTVYHKVWDRANSRFMFGPWAGPSAQDVMETEVTVINNVTDKTDPNGWFFRGGGGGGLTRVENLPLTCSVDDQDVRLPDMNVCGCTAVDTWTCNNPTAGAFDGIPAANSVGPSQLIASGVAPGTYGSATYSPTLSIDEDGVVTTASHNAIPGLIPTVGGLDAPCVNDNKVFLATDRRLYICVAEAYVLAKGTVTQAANLPASCVFGDPAVLITSDATLFVCSAANLWVANSPTAGSGSGDPGPNSVGPSQLIASGIVAGICGFVDGSTLCIPTFDEDGIATTYEEVPVAPGPGTVTSAMLADTLVTPGTYGDATLSPRITVNAKGQLTSAEDVPILATTSSILVEEDLPTPCVYKTQITLIPGVTQYFCMQDAIGEAAENKRCPDDGPCWIPYVTAFTPTITSGIQWTETDIKSMRFEPQVVASADPCNLGARTLVNVTAGATGKTCFLPDPALLTTVGEFNVHVVDENYLTLAPTNGALINGAATPMPPIKGPGSYYRVTRMSTTEWHVTSVGGLIYGKPASVLCAKFDGSTNSAASGSGAFVAHDLTCPLPANALTISSMLRVCAVGQWTTGTSVPNLSMRVKAGGTTLNLTGSVTPGTSVVNKNGAECLELVMGEEPSASSDTYSSWGMVHSGYTSTVGVNQTVQPVAVVSNTALTISIETMWSAAGTGTNTYKLMSFIVYGSGLNL